MSEPAQPISTALPGVFDLIKKGIGIYTERFKTILLVTGVWFLIFGLFFILFPLGIVGFLHSHTSISLIAAAAFLYLFAMILCVSVYLWVTLALMHVIKGTLADASFGKAFQSARPQIWSLAWVIIMTGLVTMGGLILFGLIPAGIGALIGYLLAGGVMALAFGITVGVVGFVASFLLLFVWFSQAQWSLVDTGSRGIAAMLSSKQMVEGRFWAVLGRFIGICVLLGLALSASYLFVFTLGLLLPLSVRAFTENVVTQAIDIFAFTPLILCSLFSLYDSLRSAPAIDTQKWRRGLVALAFVGLVGMILVPVAIVILGVSVLLNSAGNKALGTLGVSTSTSQTQGVPQGTPSSQYP